jgi:SAM-dependent methyltransferase
VRLNVRRARFWSSSYLTYRYLWPNLVAAITEAKSQLPSSDRIVLDVGCGNKPYADLFEDCAYFGVNYSTADANPDIVANAMFLPIASQAVDLVFCSQVIEHVQRPWRLVEECFRVLRPGGWLVLSAPFYWPLHEEPHDYFRFTRYGLESLVLSAGFSNCRIECDGGDNARFWLSAIHATPSWLRRIVQLPFNILGSLGSESRSALLPANYTVLARV